MRIDHAARQVLWCILGHVQSAEDLCSAVAACKALRAAVADAPVRVVATPAQRRSLSDPSKQPMLQLLTDWVTARCPSEPRRKGCGVAWARGSGVALGRGADHWRRRAVAAAA